MPMQWWRKSHYSDWNFCWLQPSSHPFCWTVNDPWSHTIDSCSKIFFIDETCSNENEEESSLKKIWNKLKPLPGTPTRLTSNRSTILKDSISIFKQKFNFARPLRLFKKRNSVFLTMPNTDALRSSLYKVGRRMHMVASSIIQDGPGFPNFPIGLYKCFQKPEPNALIDYIKKENVVDVDCLDALSKVTFCFLTF